MADGASSATDEASGLRGAKRQFAVMVTPLRPKTGLQPLFEALAGQTGIAEQPVTVFASVGERMPAAAAAFEAVGPDALALHLIGSKTPSTEAGECRKLLEAAAFHLERQTAGGDPVLLVIDSSAVPAPDWIANSLRAVESGADLVCGNPLPRTGSGQSASLMEAVMRYRQLVVRLEDALDPVDWDPAPRHRDESGASLALRVSRLAQAGGVPDVPADLLRHLILRIRQAGGVVRHCPRTRVFVPPHMLGDREAERRLPDAEVPMPVTDPAELEAAFRERARLRDRLERQYGELAPAERARIVRSLLSLDAFAVQGSRAALPVERACAILRRRLDELGASPARKLPVVRRAVSSPTRWNVLPRVF